MLQLVPKVQTRGFILLPEFPTKGSMEPAVEREMYVYQVFLLTEYSVAIQFAESHP